MRETQRIADENHRRALDNHRRALDLYDLIFPPWRWIKWWREYRAIRAAMREVERRNAVSEQWLARS